MAFKIFSTGTVIDSAWLNDVNAAVYTTLPGKVGANSPTLTTPNIGNATAVTVNGITFTQGTGTLTIPNGTTATVSGVNTGDQNLTNYAQFNGINSWTGSNSFTNVSFTNATATSLKSAVLFGGALGGFANSGTITFNTATASTFGLVVSGNVTIVLTGTPPAGYDQTVYVEIINGGSATVTWPAGTKFPGGVQPTLTAAGRDLLSAWYDPFNLVWVVGMIWKDYK